MVRIRRLNPGLVLRMVLGSKANPASADPESTCEGLESSEISAMAESRRKLVGV